MSGQLYKLHHKHIRQLSGGLSRSIQVHLSSARQYNTPTFNVEDLPKNQLDKVQYYFENGFRKVKPYGFTYLVRTKAKWFDKTLPEVMCSGLSNKYTTETVSWAMNVGRITVNDTVVSPEYKLKLGDNITSHDIHRHEPAIPHREIKFIHQESNFVVVDKPHGMPVHPNGTYNYNTLLRILQKENNLSPLMNPIHRLDGLTAGVLILGKLSGDKTLQKTFTENVSEKEYVCRVQGRFPDQEVLCEAPIDVQKFPFRSVVSELGKPSVTKFNRISFDGISSVVSCKLQTGRMHQIRVHLAFLGYPIANDPLYNLDFRQKNNNSAYKDLVKLPTNAFPSPENPCQLCQSPPSDPNADRMILWLKAIRYAGSDWQFEAEWPEWAVSPQ
ncbi:hypothetical protein K7432_007527 [Basidiobolus ranarum]|uniref:Pseudouridine synthase n=1 Tax=Basidiobolus ranarum TaxID=34480 RepID=A0ABR2VZX8_9FUNG